MRSLGFTLQLTYMTMCLHGSVHFCVCADVGVGMFLCVREHLLGGEGGDVPVKHSWSVVLLHCFQDSLLSHKTNKMHL